MGRKKRITRGEAAGYLGIAKNTLRNYEDLSLIEPGKGENNYRYFRDEDISVLTLIRMMREMDFSLPEIQRLTQKCSLPQVSEGIYAHIQRLLEEQRHLNSKLSRLVQFSSRVDLALSAWRDGRCELLEQGPVLLWQSREDSSRVPEQSWFSLWPSAAVSGILTLHEEGLSVETGLAIVEGRGGCQLPDPASVTRRIALGRCVHSIRACHLKDGQYLLEDYEPLRTFALESGFQPENWLITYGLAHIYAKSDPTFFLEMWMPVQE